MVRIVGGLLAALLLVACAPGERPASREAAAAQSSVPAKPKRLTAVALGEPASLSTKVNWSGPGGVFPGADAMEELVNVGLATVDSAGRLRERLGEAVPTLENGGWSLLPEGRMVTTWRIKPGARWHDGTPVTAEDLAFTAQVGRDRELGFTPVAAYELLDAVQILDAHRVVVMWKGPYIYADRLFTNGVTAAIELPLPKHLLESALQEKASFLQAPYWTSEFVGTGPYRLREWATGSHLLLSANDSFILGRPKIDDVEVRFIPDPNTLAANLLAGTVELTMGRGLNVEQALRVRDQWQAGRMEASPRNWVALNPQMLDPNPSLVADVRFRRAMLHAIDRQQLADSFQGGLSTAAHSYVHPKLAEYQDVEASVVRYEHDPRRAQQLLQEVGLSAGADGLLRDASGQRLALELRTAGGTTDLTMLAVADYWQRLGVLTDPVVIPPQRRQDREYRATFPAFELLQLSNELSTLSWQRSSEVPVPENNFVGRSKNRYLNPEYDALVDRYYGTIPLRDRTQVLAQIVHHMTDRVILSGMYYNHEPVMIGHRVQNVAPGGSGSSLAWNGFEWDII